MDGRDRWGAGSRAGSLIAKMLRPADPSTNWNRSAVALYPVIKPSPGIQAVLQPRVKCVAGPSFGLAVTAV
jgi:hypothetical protein